MMMMFALDFFPRKTCPRISWQKDGSLVVVLREGSCHSNGMRKCFGKIIAFQEMGWVVFTAVFDACTVALGDLGAFCGSRGAF